MLRNMTVPIFTNSRFGIALRRLSSGISVTSALGPLAVVVLSASATVAGAQTTAVPAAPAAEVGVDVSIKPGDDFFAYANGGWLKNTQIPAGKQRWTVGNEITERTRQQVAKLLEDAAAEPKGSTARKVADFREAYLNEAAIEAKGIAPIKLALDRIDRIRDKAGLTRLLGSGLRADVDPLNWGVFKSSHVLGLSVEVSIHGEKTYVAFLVQGGLGLPDRAYYLSAEPRMLTLCTQYQQYIGRMLAMSGFDLEASASKRAKAVMELETAIAQSHATREASANDHNADNLWTRADFARQAPGMDWSAFFAAAGLAKQATFVAWQPTAVKGVAALVASKPLQVWKDYLRFQVVDRYADVLPRAFAEQALALHRAAVTDQPQPSPRAERALEATQLAMSEALGRMYAERHFPAEQKARVQAIVANVTAAFVRRVEAAAWMTPGTRTMARAKLKTLYVGIGYPEQWQDYSDLAVNPLDAVGNVQRVADRNYRRAVALLGQPVDMTDWWIAPQMVNAVLLFQQNAYDFSAALLQTPKFDPTASDAANYGAIGAIIGHDTTHFVDTLGAEYEADGRMRRWWTVDDISNYQTSTEALVNQFSGYKPFPDLAVNGKLTLTENLDDLGGLAAAFDAYRGTLGSKVNDKDYLRQQDRQFFIGFARSWRGKMSEEGLRKYLTTDNHAPESYRIATVRNIDAWYDAFDVLPGQSLYLEPKARLRIW